jgi:hypothetical protein
MDSEEPLHILLGNVVGLATLVAYEKSDGSMWKPVKDRLHGRLGFACRDEIRPRTQGPQDFFLVGHYSAF